MYTTYCCCPGVAYPQSFISAKNIVDVSKNIWKKESHRASSNFKVTSSGNHIIVRTGGDPVTITDPNTGITTVYPIIFSIKQDKSWAEDPKPYKDVQEGSIVDLKKDTDYYITDPRGAQADFTLQFIPI